MPLIVSAGMPRSGSTWLFNAIRFLLNRSDQPLLACWIDERNEETERHARNVLIKIHSPSEALASQAEAIFTSHRDLRDVALSAHEMGWAPEPTAMMEVASAARAAHDFWAPRSKLDLNYGDIISRPVRCVKSIAAALDTATDDAEAQSIVDAIARLASSRAKDEGHDQVSLLHHGHRIDGRAGRWIGKLDIEVARAIEEANKDWLTRYGFL